MYVTVPQESGGGVQEADNEGMYPPRSSQGGKETQAPPAVGAIVVWNLEGGGPLLPSFAMSAQ
jgi:hypothetical protein